MAHSFLQSANRFSESASLAFVAPALLRHTSELAL